MEKFVTVKGTGKRSGVQEVGKYNVSFEGYEDDDTYEIYGEIGGDAVHYIIMKDDGAIYEK